MREEMMDNQEEDEPFMAGGGKNPEHEQMLMEYLGNQEQPDPELWMTPEELEEYK